MPCACTCKTSSGLAPLEVHERTAKETREGKKSFEAATQDEKID
jgi:hypothetical protein